MSYWYNRINKKHVLAMIISIFVALAMGAGQISSSYAIGCIGTASRTLYDWVTPERSVNEWEVLPFIEMMHETGCIEWLGFSTCEVVQFRDWSQIWTQNSMETIYIMNITGAVTATSVPQTELSPITLEKVVHDDGTSAEPGVISLKQRVSYKYDALPDLDGVVTTAGWGADATMSTTLGHLLGLKGAPGFLDLASQTHTSVTVTAPYGGNKQALGIKSLNYFAEVDAAKRCTFDDDCGAECSWTGKCEPQGYGHQGMLMPSATFLYNWKFVFELAQWPVVAWDYKQYCPASEFDPNCENEKSRLVTVFDPGSYSRTLFANTGEGTAEKFADLEIQVWKGENLVRREEGCGTTTTGRKGKDCGVPSGYAWIAPNLYLSFPKDLKPEIYSERVTGLRMDYSHVGQVNYWKVVNTANEKFEVIIPLFWMQSKPIFPMAIMDTLQFDALKDYGSSMGANIALGFIIYTVTYFIFCFMLLWGLACCSFASDQAPNKTPFAEPYI